MAKVDINPFSNDGEADLASVDGWIKVAFTVISFASFFALLNVSQATVQPIIEGFLGQIPNVNTGESGEDVEVV